MPAPAYIRSSLGLAKRVKIDPLKPNFASLSRQPVSHSFPMKATASRFGISTTAAEWQADVQSVPPHSGTEGFPPSAQDLSAGLLDPNAAVDSEPRLPRSVQAVYLTPLKRQAKYGVPSCDLQLRSYNVRNVEFFADFALRAAYYLKLPAAGPIPLPRIIERWTVPKSNFVHKKSQENFERITLRRLIQIQDGHPETVEIWLAFLRKHAYYGVGMKANVWEHEKLEVGKTMDVSLDYMKRVLEPKWAHFGRKKNLDTSEKVMEMMTGDRFRHTADAPLSEPWG